MKRRHNSESGFTLAEVMVASVILVLAVVTGLIIAAQSFRYLTDIRRTARSSQVLQQQMESIRLMTWSQILSLPSTFQDSADTNRIYSGIITTSAYDTYSSTTTAMRVTLTVTWTNQASQTVLTNRLTAVITNGGLNKYFF